jgi:hypothetical protein
MKKLLLCVGLLGLIGCSTKAVTITLYDASGGIIKQDTTTTPVIKGTSYVYYTDKYGQTHFFYGTMTVDETILGESVLHKAGVE